MEWRRSGEEEKEIHSIDSGKRMGNKKCGGEETEKKVRDVANEISIIWCYCVLRRQSREKK